MCASRMARSCEESSTKDRPANASGADRESGSAGAVATVMKNSSIEQKAVVSDERAADV